MSPKKIIKQDIKTEGRPQAIDFDYNICSPEEIISKFSTSEKGLNEKEAQKRLAHYGYNEPPKKKTHGVLYQLLSKFINPLVIVLIIIGVFSYFFGEKISAALVGVMIVMSVMLGFIQEYRSSKEVEKLMAMVTTKVTVYRNGKPREIGIREIVPGDVIDLYAGDIIPADLRIISSKDLFINQAPLTGESLPVEKTAKALEKAVTSVSDMHNIAFMGSSVVSGTGFGVAIKTGIFTQFGELSSRLSHIQTESSFEKGVNSFTWIMIRAMAVMVAVIFLINAVFKHNIIDAFLFSLAVAVGLTPEMLPLIITINLSKGAGAMSKKKVIVKRLNSIQNFGAMGVLCTDKTGTLTMDKVVLEMYCDVMRQEDNGVLKYAMLNSYYQTGLKNILDHAILKQVTKHPDIDIASYKKVDEIPFDFSRRIMSVVVEMDGKQRVISKGAPEEIFKRCTNYELDGEIIDMEYIMLEDLKEEYKRLSADGFRVLAIAYRDIDAKQGAFTKDDESSLILKGYVAFLDPPKPSATKAILALKKLGVQVKVITGDNELVTKKICGEVGLDVKGMLTGDEVEKMSDEALREAVKTTTVFARMSPVQKESVIRALHANNHIVGFMGDGINDTLALKVSDVGISVNNAVDIAKESADIILLEKNLMVLEDGVREGRKTFGNIVKYIKMASSSNFGNMLSMTGASLFLPFLPMAPIQILLNNFLYDLSQTVLSSDSVDEEYVKKPRPWNIKSIQRYMLFIGPVSSIFDFITFAVLYFIFGAITPDAHGMNKIFNTGWFMESLITQTLVIYVIRTVKIPFLQSRPSLFLMISSLLIVAFGCIIPFTQFSDIFSFVKPEVTYFVALTAIVVAYLLLVYFVQQWFVKKFGND